MDKYHIMRRSNWSFLTGAKEYIAVASCSIESQVDIQFSKWVMFIIVPQGKVHLAAPSNASCFNVSSMHGHLSDIRNSMPSYPYFLVSNI